MLIPYWDLMQFLIHCLKQGVLILFPLPLGKLSSDWLPLVLLAKAV